MDKENLVHILRHDLRTEIKASLNFIEFMIQDLEDSNTSEEEIRRNLNILKQTFKNLEQKINEINN